MGDAPRGIDFPNLPLQYTLDVTANGPETSGPPVNHMKLEALLRLERDARRIAEIIGVLARYGLADWLRNLHIAWLQDKLRSEDGQTISDLPFEQRARLALAELGTTFIKLGQVLSTRSDLIGPELADELAHLQSSAPEAAPEEIAALLEKELGQPPEAIFGTFDRQSFAAASIAQVHHARLPTGECVVVKIQRPGIVDQVRADLEILEALAELAQKYSTQLKPYQPVQTVRQFKRTLLRELDFSSELRNLEQFRRNFEEDETIHFPKPWSEYSSSRVLTMEFLEGIPGTQIDELRASGADLNLFARRGADLFLKMIFRDSFYHADPHPGNLILLPDLIVGVIDGGMTGRLDEALREEVEYMLLGMMERDSAAVTDVVLRIGNAPADCPRDRLLTDIDEFLGEYVNQPLAELDLSAALNNLAEIIRRYHVTLPVPLALLLRMLVVLEGTSRRLNPEFNLAEVIRPFYETVLRRRWGPRRLFHKLQRTYRDWDRLLEALPRDLTNLLARIRQGTFNVHLDHRHLDPVINRLVLGIITAAMFLSSSFLWALKAPPLAFGVSIVGVTGYIIAIYLGWRLYRAVKRTGDIDSKD